jgi:hypothetical protein
MLSWMKKLALHYEKTRKQYPNDKLMILFDIDGTILDMRYMIHYMLKAFDHHHQTHFFEILSPNQIDVHENQVDTLLARLDIPIRYHDKILCWYHEYRWSSQAILSSHRSFKGVMEVIRWFQIQPNTYVALNTGRPECLREDTLRSINKIGKQHKVLITNDFLYMSPNDSEHPVKCTKVAGVRHYQKAGFRVFAMIDNEPENLKAISEIDPDSQIVLLHADTIFESRRKKLPSDSLSGSVYDITELINENTLPEHIQFVWHGVNDFANLRQFTGSNIQWVECDVRMHPKTHQLILRHDSYENTPLKDDEDPMHLCDLLNRIKVLDRSIKLDLKENGQVIDETLKLVQSVGFNDSALWFNGELEIIGEKGFRKLKKTHPDAILQCPIDRYAPLILSRPQKTRQLLFTFLSWGINRFSIKWGTSHIMEILDHFDQWGFGLNIYNVPDLASFLQAVLLLPKSITSDFNFPKWHYFGRGSGKNQQYYEYSLTQLSPSIKEQLQQFRSAHP